MIKFGYWATLVGWILLTLCFFVFPSRPIALGSLACVILGWVMIGWRMILFYRARNQAAKPVQLSPQQVMRNTRAELPDEYVEWFDWTAELAGFDLPAPARRSPVLIDNTVTKVDYAQALIASRLYAQPKNPQIEIKDGQVVDNPDGGIRPYGICSYGPGVGWEEDWIVGHHVWIRRQS